MDEYAGKILHRGIAIGRIHFLKSVSAEPAVRTIADPEAEIARFENAKLQAASELDELKRQAAEAAGENIAGIFAAQSVMLSDEEFVQSVLDMIRSEKVNTEHAVSVCADRYAGILRGVEDEYIRQRVSDLLDVANRIIRILSGQNNGLTVSGPAVITAFDLLPSDTLMLNRRFILAFVTSEGSPLSHAAILARGMDIPALSGIPVSESWDGHRVVVDADRGVLILDPDEGTLSAAAKKKALGIESRKQYIGMKGKDSATSDGKQIRLYANIGSIDDIPSALENDAEGIGLFRTEFLYIGRRTLPGEEEQFLTYRKAAEMMKGRPVTIRTMDLGADKPSGLPGILPEKNPALGFRGIRLCLNHEDLFCSQLRAVYRASAFGNLSIMFPMITSVREVREIRRLIRKVTDRLTDENIAWRQIPVGIMIETPSSALLSDELAQEVDFFSIGTNDLTQYTLAMDRQNGSLDSFYDPYSEAVMREIAITVKNGHRWGCQVGICGELGADTSMTDRLLKMGVDELSVSPHMILPVRKAVRESNTDPDPREDT